MIQSEETIVIPPVQAKSYNSLWIYNLSFHAPTPQNGRMKAEFLPYNEVTKEIGPADYLQTVQTDKLWQAVEAVPEVKTAFEAIVAAVGPLKAWIKAQAELPPQ